MKTIGIVGGGQLGRMLTDAAHSLGFKTVVLDATPNGPAGQVADGQIVGDVKDGAKIKELASRVDVLTFEIELADSDTLIEIQKSGVPVHPSPETLHIIRDKHAQKMFLREVGVHTADFMDVPDATAAQEAGRTFGYPFLLKAKRDSYDGRGNATIEKESDISGAFQKLKGRELYAERFIRFTKELAVMAARDAKGNISSFPAVETTHKNYICDTVIAPAPVPDDVADAVRAFAEKIMESLGGQGVYGIEMFYVEPGTVMVNEIAPRVHNSGHLTIEANETSQFEQHIRAVTGMPLGDTRMKVPAAVMLNIIGTRNGPADPKGFEEIAKEPGTYVHLYGKKETRVGRKMGHVTVTAETLEEAKKKAEKIRLRVTI